MSKQNQDYLANYKNLLEKGYNLMTKSYDPVVPIKKHRRPTPEQVKLRVMNSQRLNKYLDDVSESKNDRQRKVLEVQQMLSEIAFDRNLIVLRTLGSIIGKLMNQLYTSVLINETSLNNLKSSFGNQQVIYLPSHRSYADFMLMSFICFSYNLEVPAIAAGMDFHGMMGLGEMLRKTGAFFMRRSFSSDDAYWRVFKEYMHEVITHNDFGLEFFIEGTRSRSCKALSPKTGLLSMALEPYFMGEIHDIKVVPVSVSYEKPLEEQLFVYELLGIPKPKESTMGFIKAVTNLKNQNLGRVYFDIGEPISLNTYYGASTKRFKHSIEPAFVQTLDRDDMNLVTDLANEVVRRQQDKIVIMPYNLIALIYNEAVFTGTTASLTMWHLKKELIHAAELFEQLGAIVSIKAENLDHDIKETFTIHKNILEITGNNSYIKIIKAKVNLGAVNVSKLKGIRLSDEVMNIVVPVFSLQLYCNPTLFWLSEPAFFVLSTIGVNSIDVLTLMQEVSNLRKIFVYEFVLYPGFENEISKKVFDSLLSINVLVKTETGIRLNTESNYINLLLSSVAPFINCYLNTSRTILDGFKEKHFKEKDVFIAAQSHVEKKILEGKCEVHPYSLCLDSISMVILSLCNYGCLFKEKQLSLNFCSYQHFELIFYLSSDTE